MELSPRLHTIAQAVPKGARLADIGTDHAYLPVWLLQHGVIDDAIAADLRPGPLERAKETANKFCLSDKLDFRLCDGLTGVCAEEVDCIVIAGMGGETIVHILSDAPWTKEEGNMLILQPMSSQEDLRRWLVQNGYQIVREKIALEEKTFYTIMVAEPGVDREMTAAEELAGRQSSDPLRGAYLAHLITKVNRALEGQRSASKPDEAVLAKTEGLLNELVGMKKEWEAWQL